MRHIFLMIFIVLMFGSFGQAAGTEPDIVAKHVRSFIKKGNEAYRSNDYAKAETYYRDALQEDKNSSVALFNLALTLLRKNGNPLANKEQEQGKQDKALTDPVDMFNEVIALNRDENLVASAFYNLGNMYFDAGNYAESIQQYKNVLRLQPDHIKARQNLRVAQLKLEEQKQNQNQRNQQNQQNQDKKDNEQKQNENKNNPNPNKDKKEEEQKQQGQDNAKQNQQPPQQKNDGSTSSGRPVMSKDNSDKILESVKKSEEQTRKKVEQRKANQTSRRTTDRPW